MIHQLQQLILLFQLAWYSNRFLNFLSHVHALMSPCQMATEIHHGNLFALCRLARKQYGLLEKKKDYRLRSRDFHRKEDHLKVRLYLNRHRLPICTAMCILF